MKWRLKYFRELSKTELGLNLTLHLSFLSLYFLIFRSCSGNGGGDTYDYCYEPDASKRMEKSKNIHWLKEGKPINATDPSLIGRVTGVDTNTLRIIQLNKSVDAGAYSCRLTKPVYVEAEGAAGARRVINETVDSSSAVVKVTRRWPCDKGTFADQVR